MYYYTVKLSPRYHQISLEEYLCSSDVSSYLITNNEANTRTYKSSHINDKMLSTVNVDLLINILKIFNLQTESLRQVNRDTLYYKFKIPKKSGGLREICAPSEELKNALNRLKDIFEIDFKSLYHTNAYAYIKNRCTVDAVKKHQQNRSKWFAKLDLKDFFGSSNIDFVLDMMGKVFPFSEILKNEVGKAELTKAIELGFLNNALPQGTPLSPIITNIMSIPIDYELSKKFREESFIYTRYADDFLVSSTQTFDVSKVEQIINSTLLEFNAPFLINPTKTRYGSSNGKNWNLGVMLNRDNNITIGHQKKRIFKSMLYNYAKDKKANINWSHSDVQVLNGHIAYYRAVEKEYINGVIRHMSQKTSLDILKNIKIDLKR